MTGDWEYPREPAALTAAYEERNQLVAALSGLYASHTYRDDSATAKDGFRTVVCVHLPAGQAAWHVPDAGREMFAHLGEGPAHWDGHDTAEKYRRVADLIRRPA